MLISRAGLDLIARFEGFVDHLYNDPAGHCTVGYGHLLHLGRCDGRAVEHPYRNGITRSAAEELLRVDAQRYEDCVNRLVTVPLNQNQFDALVSFTFNVGCGALNSSTLLRYLNQGRYNTVCDQLKRWVRGGGVVLPGLVRRRNEECELFNRAYIRPAPTPPVLPIPLIEEDDDVANVMVKKNGNRAVLLTNGVRSWHIPSGTLLRQLQYMGVPGPATITREFFDALWNQTRG